LLSNLKKWVKISYKKILTSKKLTTLERPFNYFPPRHSLLVTATP
jgi:hypothetical protein